MIDRFRFGNYMFKRGSIADFRQPAPAWAVLNSFARRPASVLHGDPRKEVTSMVMAINHSVISLIAGILILIMPKLLNYIVAVYLIVTGILGLIR